MGESSDGSTAAQGALDHDESTGNGSSRGFLGRILTAFGGAEPSGSGGDDSVEGAGAAPITVEGHGLGALRRLRVGDIAIPKHEIVAVPVAISREDLVETFREHGFSRLPVFRGTLDSPLGLVHLKDLALNYGFGAQSTGPFGLRKMLRPLLFAPPSMPIGVLLQKMQTDRIHMALVIDEYGGVDGLVTIEDLIEQVIGEIEDEHDEAEGRLWLQEKPGQWLVQAQAPLEDFEQAIGRRVATEDESDEVDSLGGLIFMRSGRVPSRGEVIPGIEGVEFEVVDADPRRIKRLRVRMPLLDS